MCLSHLCLIKACARGGRSKRHVMMNNSIYYVILMYGEPQIVLQPTYIAVFQSRLNVERILGNNSI